jgi:hypothetical protein
VAGIRILYDVGNDPRPRSPDRGAQEGTIHVSSISCGVRPIALLTMFTSDVGYPWQRSELALLRPNCIDD